MTFTASYGIQNLATMAFHSAREVVFLGGTVDDKLAPIRKVFEMFVASLRLSYIHKEYITADGLIPFHGQWSFR